MHLPVNTNIPTLYFFHISLSGSSWFLHRLLTSLKGQYTFIYSEKTSKYASNKRKSNVSYYTPAICKATIALHSTYWSVKLKSLYNNCLHNFFYCSASEQTNMFNKPLTISTQWRPWNTVYQKSNSKLIREYMPQEKCFVYKPLILTAQSMILVQRRYCCLHEIQSQRSYPSHKQPIHRNTSPGICQSSINWFCPFMELTSRLLL